MAVSRSLPDPRVLGSRRLDVARTLAPVVRTIGLRYVTRGALFGFAAGVVAGAIVLVAAHVWTFGVAVPAAVVIAALGALAGVAVGVARWPRAMDAARAVDLHFGLEDRLTTALELREDTTPVAVLQSRDLEQRIDGLSLSGVQGRWLRRNEVAGVVLAALVFAGALVLGPAGSAHHAAARAPSTSTHQRHAAAQQVKKLTSQLHLGLTPSQLRSPAMRKLDAILSRLQHRLAHASSRAAALRAISATQQQLRQLAQGLHPVNARAVAQLNSSLSHYLQQGRHGKANPSARSNPATAQALNRLAQALAHLTPSQRAALARALARSANATSNNALRQSLRQAASDLANGQPQAGSQALQQAAQMLTQSGAARAAQSRAGAAQSQLNGLKNQVAGQTPGRGTGTSPGQGKQGAATGAKGAGNKPKSGTGAGRGQGTRPGQGQGQGRGQRVGQGRGTGKGRGRASGQATVGRGQRGTAGAHGTGGRGTSSRTRSGKTVTVYVPGKQGTGPTINRTGPQGAPSPGAIVPYQQVVGRYAQSAHQALDRTNLPPALQGYVRRYFSTLSH